jgi:peroxiredoxin Q/BCP
MSDTHKLTEGDLAPDFSLPRDGGAQICLSDLRPNRVVVYFYPKDDTSGCTVEAKDFTAMAPDFAAADVTVIGISKDSVKAHDKFIAKHALGVILASDEAGTTCEDFGVWVEKQMYGKTYMGIERATFLISGSGHVEKIWRKVKAKDHAETVLGAVKGG